MRVYLFTEAIVRYAATKYAHGSSARGVVLTNTYVGKQLLHHGVKEITGTLHQLGSDLKEEAGLSFAALLHAMRLAIGRLFLTFEPRLKSHYQNYAATGASAPTPGGGGYHGGGKASAYLCRNCYHLFGVDLIADERREFKVIEVNIEPDLTLSAGKEGASMPCPPICGSNHGRATSRQGRSLLLTRVFGPHVGTDDDTKRAVAWNAMQVVFARPSAAATLHQLLSAARPELSTILRGAAEMGDAMLYLLGAVREGKALGCFLPVYPSPAGHRALGAHLLDMSQDSRFDYKARLRLHAAFDAVLGSASAAWRQPYQVRCAASMRDVAQKHPDDPFDNAWARRKSILHDIPPVED